MRSCVLSYLLLLGCAISIFGQTNPGDDVHARKARVIQNWLQRFNAIEVFRGNIGGPDGPHLQLIRDGRRLTSCEVCCEVANLIAALRRVLASAPSGPISGERDVETPLIVNVHGIQVPVRLLLGDFKSPLVVGGGAGEIVIVDAVEGSDADATAGPGGIAIAVAGGGEINDSKSRKHGKGGSANAIAGAFGQAIACSGRGGDGDSFAEPGRDGGDSGDASATVRADDKTKSAGDGEAYADSGDGGTGGNNTGSPDNPAGGQAGDGGKAGSANATVENGAAGSVAEAGGGGGGNGGNSGQKNMGGHAKAGGDARAEGSRDNRANGGQGGGAGLNAPAPPSGVNPNPNGGKAEVKGGGTATPGEKTDFGKQRPPCCELDPKLIEALLK